MDQNTTCNTTVYCLPKSLLKISNICRFPIMEWEVKPHKISDQFCLKIFYVLSCLYNLQDFLQSKEMVCLYFSTSSNQFTGYFIRYSRGRMGRQALKIPKNSLSSMRYCFGSARKDSRLHGEKEQKETGRGVCDGSGRDIIYFSSSPRTPCPNIASLL